MEYKEFRDNVLPLAVSTVSKQNSDNFTLPPEDRIEDALADTFLNKNHLYKEGRGNYLSFMKKCLVNICRSTQSYDKKSGSYVSLNSYDFPDEDVRPETGSLCEEEVDNPELFDAYGCFLTTAAEVYNELLSDEKILISDEYSREQVAEMLHISEVNVGFKRCQCREKFALRFRAAFLSTYRGPNGEAAFVSLLSKYRYGKTITKKWRSSVRF